MKHRVIAALLITVLLLSLAGCAVTPTDSASPDTATPDQLSNIRHRLVKSVKSFQKNAKTDEWELANTINITYENAYPALIETVYTDTEKDPSKTRFDYTFDGDLPETCIETADADDSKKTVEYQNGRVYTIRYETGTADSDTKIYYRYDNDDEYFTKVQQEMHAAASEDSAAANNEEVDSITVTTENGLLKKTVNTGEYANWIEGEKKEWLRFRGVYTADYDGDGIVNIMTGDFGKDGIRIEKQFVVTRADGKITEVIEQIPDGDSWTDLTRLTFEYDETEISPARYSLMMNYFIAGSQSKYYHYNWY